MPWFHTAYSAWGIDPPESEDAALVGFYGTCLWARSRRHAESVARHRNVGERILGPAGGTRPEPIASSLLRTRMRAGQKLDFIHAVTFLGFLAQRSLGADARSVLGDEGLVHMAIHAMSFGWPRRERLRPVVAYFESRVPGYLRGS